MQGEHTSSDNSNAVDPVELEVETSQASGSGVLSVVCVVADGNEGESEDSNFEGQPKNEDDKSLEERLSGKPSGVGLPDLADHGTDNLKDTTDPVVVPPGDNGADNLKGRTDPVVESPLTTSSPENLNDFSSEQPAVVDGKELHATSTSDKSDSATATGQGALDNFQPTQSCESMSSDTIENDSLSTERDESAPGMDKEVVVSEGRASDSDSIVTAQLSNLDPDGCLEDVVTAPANENNRPVDEVTTERFEDPVVAPVQSTCPTSESDDDSEASCVDIDPNESSVGTPTPQKAIPDRDELPSPVSSQVNLDSNVAPTGEPFESNHNTLVKKDCTAAYVGSTHRVEDKSSLETDGIAKSEEDERRQNVLPTENHPPLQDASTATPRSHNATSEDSKEAFNAAVCASGSHVLMEIAPNSEFVLHDSSEFGDTTKKNQIDSLQINENKMSGPDESCVLSPTKPPSDLTNPADIDLENSEADANACAPNFFTGGNRDDNLSDASGAGKPAIDCSGTQEVGNLKEDTDALFVPQEAMFETCCNVGEHHSKLSSAVVHGATSNENAEALDEATADEASTLESDNQKKEDLSRPDMEQSGSEDEPLDLMDSDAREVGRDFADIAHPDASYHEGSSNREKNCEGVSDTGIIAQPGEAKTCTIDAGTFEATRELCAAQDTVISRDVGVSDSTEVAAGKSTSSVENSQLPIDCSTNDKSHCTKDESVTRPDTAHLRRLFDLFERDQFECISAAEIITSLRALGFDPSKAEVSRIIEEHNVGPTLDFTLFSKIVCEFVPENRPDITDALKAFDNANHVINLDDFRRIMMTQGESLTSDECSHLLEHVQVPKDGNVRFDDFVDALVHSSLRSSPAVF